MTDPEIHPKQIAKHERAVVLAKMQRTAAEQLLKEMGCVPASDNYDLVLVNMMQVIASNHLMFDQNTPQ